MSQRRFGLFGLEGFKINQDEKMKELQDKVSGKSTFDRDRLTLVQGQGF